jgi:putative transposase
MLTTEEFRAWCQRNEIGPETEAAIQRIRSSPPTRRVRGGTSNVSGRYPSMKMGCSIQFESQHVELWAIYAMERDDNVLEYYDQPTRIQLHYHARSGRKTSPWHTPDFFVIRRDGAGFEEWKPTDALDKLAVRMPECYQREASGRWQCPPGETAAHALGLSYRVRTSNEYHPLSIQNLKVLQDFWTHPFTLTAETQAQVLQALRLYPGVSVAAFLDAYPEIAVDVIWYLLASQQIFTDLAATSLMSWEEVFLYLSFEEVEAAKQPNTAVIREVMISSPLIF